MVKQDLVGFFWMMFLRYLEGFLPENQISLNLRFYEIIKAIEINENIANIKLIHATYRILKDGVKL
jgi:hypothetical protein